MSSRYTQLQQKLLHLQDFKKEIEIKLSEQNTRNEAAKELAKQSQIYKKRMNSILERQQKTYSELKLENDSIAMFNKNISTILKSKQFNAYQLNKCLQTTLTKLLCFIYYQKQKNITKFR